MYRLSLFLLALLMAIAPSFAQGIIRGAVTDEAGKPQPGVTVVFRNGSASPAISNTNTRGIYTSPSLVPGTYTVTFFAAGYETQRYIEVVVQGSAHIIVNAGLAKAGKWGSSIAMHRYVPAPPVVKAIRRKHAYRLSGIYPSTGTVTIAEAAPPSPAPPIIEPAKPGGRAVKAAESIEKSPTRNVSDVASFSTGASPGSSSLSIGGARTGSTRYVVDGAALPPPAPRNVPSMRYEKKADKTDSRIALASHAAIISAPDAHAGSLTSGEINDFSKWTLWEDMSMEALKSYRSAWPFCPEARYTVLVKSKDGSPLSNARVRLSNGSSKVWEAFTDNTGKAELWYGMWDTGKAGGARLSAGIDYGSQHYVIPSLKPFAEGANILSTNLPCLNPAKLDIAFIVDATGSMQDEINYLKAELRDILQKVKDSMPMQVQTGAIFYRDLEDAYITRTSDLTADFSKTEAFIADNNADGGGDFPEALDVALEEGLTSLHWNADATARLAFLVLDAPPHNDAATIKHMQALTAQYAARGIRLIPVVCSGSDKSTEYLMRSLALATNGTYLFLTDHSGIGGAHTAPTTDKYDVEYLNGLIYRVIYQCSYMPACKAAPPTTGNDTVRITGPATDSATITWRYYPNPTTGILHIEHTHTSGYLLITDITGKAILRIPANPSGTTTIDLGQYPAGIYAIRYNWEGDKWVSGKFVVTH